MIIKASGRAAMIVAAGLFALFASPAMAANEDDSTSGAASDSQATPVTLHRTLRHASHQRRHYAHRRHHPIARGDDDNKAAPTETAASVNKTSPGIPPRVANANAQMLLADAQISAAAAIPSGTDGTATAPTTMNVGNQTVLAAADQLNETDRTVQEGDSTAVADPTPPAPTTAAVAPTSDSAWDQSSLIGKIFIGFGALLTMASAARMFLS
jgi:hypothetical protein